MSRPAVDSQSSSFANSGVLALMKNLMRLIFIKYSMPPNISKPIDTCHFSNAKILVILIARTAKKKNTYGNYSYRF
tara:strand:+ start:225 stop:452 length:228 start_codon:yes stop_codon:yes gene_type:complete